jgi:hypothetical protein
MLSACLTPAQVHVDTEIPDTSAPVPGDARHHLPSIMLEAELEGARNYGSGGWGFLIGLPLLYYSKWSPDILSGGIVAVGMFMGAFQFFLGWLSQIRIVRWHDRGDLVVRLLRSAVALGVVSAIALGFLGNIAQDILQGGSPSGSAAWGSLAGGVMGTVMLYRVIAGPKIDILNTASPVCSRSHLPDPVDIGEDGERLVEESKEPSVTRFLASTYVAWTGGHLG